MKISRSNLVMVVIWFLLVALTGLTRPAPAVQADSRQLPDGTPAPRSMLGPKNTGDAWVTTDFDTAEDWYAFSLESEGEYTVGLDRGVLYLELPGTFENVYVFHETPLDASDVRLEAVVENVSPVTANNISLVCRAGEGGWYEFSINSGGFWHIWKLADGQFTELATGATKVINQKRARNVITAACIGSELTLYVNYRKVGSTKDRAFQDGGQVGIGVSSFAIPGVAVDIDRFSATVP